MRKVPIIILSITYKGVKFIDAANKVSHCMHTLLISLRVFRVLSYMHISPVAQCFLLVTF